MSAQPLNSPLLRKKLLALNAAFNKAGSADNIYYTSLLTCPSEKFFLTNSSCLLRNDYSFERYAGEEINYFSPFKGLC
jgi:hypothetical protein